MTKMTAKRTDAAAMMAAWNADVATTQIVQTVRGDLRAAPKVAPGMGLNLKPSGM